MSKLCIIPARGGSKRIPRKNINIFLGKPIIAYSIKTALESKLFDEVMVSTEDDEIADIAKHYGASVPFKRSEKNSDDFANTMDVISEVHRSYKKMRGVEFQYICCIYPTAPLIQIKHIVEGFFKLRESNFTSVIPIVAFSYPVWRGVEIYDGDNIKMVWPEFLNSRSQDLRKVYHDAGQWYWFNFENIENWEFPNNTGSIILSEEDVQDIDTITDWKLAEIKYSLIKAN